MRRLSFATTMFLSLCFLSALAQMMSHQIVSASPDIVVADANDGYVDSNSHVYMPYAQMSLGDWNTNYYAACFVKFNLSGVSGTLSSAILQLYLYTSLHDNITDSESPLTNIGLGDCQVIHIADYGSLDASDLSATSIGNDPGILIGESATPDVGIASIDVKAAMQDDINNARAWSTFMLTMSGETDDDNYNDYWVFRTSEYGDAAQQPIVEYGLEPEPPIYQGDLVLAGNNVTVITGRFDINGSIIVEENATLVLRNASLNFAQNEDFQFEMKFQNPSDGNPRLLVENATIGANDYNLELDLYGNSSASVNMLSAPMLYFYGYGSSVIVISNSSILDVGGSASPFVSLSDCSVYYAEVRDDSTFDMFNCTIQILQAYSTNRTNVTDSSIENYVALVVNHGNCSTDGLMPGLVAAWDFQQNCSSLIAPGGWVTNLTLTNAQVNGWSFEIYVASNATISNSDLKSIYIGDSSELLSTNSTIQSYSIRDEAEVFVSWYLDVHVVDSIDQDVPSANVTATYPNATAAESKLTDANGWARLTLMEKMLNATGEYPVGNYDVEAAYETHSNSTSMNMAYNQLITLTLEDFVIPEFPSALVLPLIMTVTLLAVMFCRKRLAIRTNANPNQRVQQN